MEATISSSKLIKSLDDTEDNWGKVSILDLRRDFQYQELNLEAIARHVYETQTTPKGKEADILTMIRRRLSTPHSKRSQLIGSTSGSLS